MYKSVIFYNHFNNGDLFESREFIRGIMEQVQAEEYYYAHIRNPRTFADFKNMKHMQIDGRMNLKSPSAYMNGDVFINTWIGRDPKYVLPRIGCTIDNNLKMFNDALKKLKLPLLNKSLYEYLPTVDYSCFEIAGVDKFVKKNKNRKKILICNGQVNSSQAANFSFTTSIETLSSKYKDILFILTEGIDCKNKNVISASSVTQTSDGYDLNEITYLSTFVDMIVGRKSGPFVFAHPKDVWYSDKKSLSFTYERHSSHFVQEDGLPLRKYWSASVDVDEVTSKIEEVINV